MFALAAALLVGIAVFAAAGPEDEGWQKVAEVKGEAEATIDDVMLYELPGPVTGRDGDFRAEAAVEGHTTFATLDVQLYRNQTEGTLKVTGFVNCTNEAQFKTYNVAGAEAPYRLDYAHVECRFAETVYIRPSTNTSPSTWYSPMYPTSNAYPFTAPSGETGTVHEYVYEMHETQADGSVLQRTLYAWEVPILHNWIDENGRPKSFLAPIPKARIAEMGIEHYDILLHDDPRLQR